MTLFVTFVLVTAVAQRITKSNYNIAHANTIPHQDRTQKVISWYVCPVRIT